MTSERNLKPLIFVVLLCISLPPFYTKHNSVHNCLKYQHNFRAAIPVYFDSDFGDLFRSSNVLITNDSNKHFLWHHIFLPPNNSTKTRFITGIDCVIAAYWSHFSYGPVILNYQEFNYIRPNRWDKAIWSQLISVQFIEGEDFKAIKREHPEKIEGKLV